MRLPTLSTLALYMGLLATGCTTAVPVKAPDVLLHGDESFTLTERQECVQWAADKWYQQTQGLADLQVVWDVDSGDVKSLKAHQSDNRLLKLSSTSPMTVEQDKESYEDCMDGLHDDGACKTIKLMGITSPSGGIKSPVHTVLKQNLTVGLVTDRFTDIHVCRLVTLHEFGHVFGIPHQDHITSIMFPSVVEGQSECMKPEDLMAFCYANDCGAVQMKPCKEDQVLLDWEKSFSEGG